MEHGLLSVYMSQAVQSFMLVNTNSPHAPFFMCRKQLSIKAYLIIALKQYRLYHSNDTASLAWLQVSLFTWLAIPV